MPILCFRRGHDDLIFTWIKSAQLPAAWLVRHWPVDDVQSSAGCDGAAASVGTHLTISISWHSQKCTFSLLSHLITSVELCHVIWVQTKYQWRATAEGVSGYVNCDWCLLLVAEGHVGVPGGHTPYTTKKRQTRGVIPVIYSCYYILMIRVYTISAVGKVLTWKSHWNQLTEMHHVMLLRSGIAFVFIV